MKVYTFIAESAAEAVAQIRAQLGADAVVLNVRQLKHDGLQKIWKRPRIEVLAHLPEAEPAPGADPLQALSDLRREIADLKQQIPLPPMPKPVLVPEPVVPASRIDYGPWKVGSFLEQTGVLPRNVQRIIETIEAEHGAEAPEGLVKQLDLARAAVLKLSQSLVTSTPAKDGFQVFVGPPGVGKTTVLSKRLAHASLIEGLPTRVLRLDGARANTAESLSVYSEILGTPVERCLGPHTDFFPCDLVFVDLPGVSATDTEGLTALAKQVAAFPNAQVHLTLNAAYETSTLLQQLRAFSFLPITSLIFTHLDEEQRWGKLLNFCLGTKCPIAYLSAGQNVPGELTPGSLQKILSRVIPSK